MLASLSERKTTRTISSKELPLQAISNLLWAGFGINRDSASFGKIGDPEVQKSYYFTDTGFIVQNIYLCTASFGLAARFHNCDKENIISEFKLKPTQRVLFAQTVGYAE